MSQCEGENPVEDALLEKNHLRKKLIQRITPYSTEPVSHSKRRVLSKFVKRVALGTSVFFEKTPVRCGSVFSRSHQAG